MYNKNKDIITNITNTQFKHTLGKISQLKNSSIDSPLLSKNYRELLNEQ